MIDKESWAWDETDLLQLVNQQVDESSELEYKGPDALGKTDGKKNEISKDVSAFANSAGGTLVYGIRESNGQAPRVPEVLDGVDPSEFPKEWLEQVLNSRIRPKIGGLHIRPIWLSGNMKGKVAYIVCVPQSATAHQASDHRYYKRYNFESVPMEHYEIMDVLNRVAHPEVEAEFGWRSRSPEHGYDNQDRIIISLSVRLQNVGHRVADRVSLQFWIPEGYNARPLPNPYSQRNGQTVSKDGIQQKAFIYYHKQPEGLFPLFPGTEHEIFDGNYGYVNLYLFKGREGLVGSEYITWEVYADNAKPKTGKVCLRELFLSEPPTA